MPAFPLHVNGTVGSELGISLGGTAPVTVDAAGVVGGRLTILASRNVGIIPPSPPLLLFSNLCRSL